MIKLDNIAVDVLRVYENDPIIQVLVDLNAVQSVQDLIYKMDNYPWVDWDPVKQKIEALNYYIEKSNKLGKEPIAFYPKEYSNPSIEFTDALNKGDILILSRPTTKSDLNAEKFCYKTVESIKRQISHTKASGANYLLSNMYYIGTNIAPTVINALDMFTDQVERQAQLCDLRVDNIFTYQQEEKLNLVDQLYEHIVARLIYKTKELAWGELSDAQKRMYISSIVNNQQRDKIIREKIQTYIANYTTLPELENVAKGNYEVLHRFIKK